MLEYQLLLSISIVVVSSASGQTLQDDRYCIGRDDGLYPDPEDCTQFYSCSYEQSNIQVCPAGLFFDPPVGVCNWPWAVTEERKKQCSVTYDRLLTSAPMVQSTRSSHAGALTTAPMVQSTRSSHAGVPAEPSTTVTSTTTITTAERAGTQSTAAAGGKTFKQVLPPVNYQPRPTLQSSNMPQELVVNFEMGSGSVNLSLVKRHNDSSHEEKVFIGRGGRLTRWTNPHENMDFAPYIDSTGSSETSIIASFDPNNAESGIMTYRGSFLLNNTLYSLMPRIPGAMNMVPRGENNYEVEIDGAAYNVAELNLEYQLPYDDSMTMNSTQISSLSRLEFLIREKEIREGEEEEKENGKDKKNVKDRDYGIEHLIVVDYTIYYKWYMISTEASDEDRHNDAIQNIRYYFAHIANSIDARYSTLRAGGLNVYVRLVGLYIATTPGDSYFTEGPEVKREGLTISGDSLKLLQKWIKEKEADFPTFDVATLFTGNRLWTGAIDRNGQKMIVAGVSRAEGVCSSGRAAVSYEFGQYSSTVTAAHEIAHTLGAFHDGDGNFCSSDDQFIMAVMAQSTTEKNALNPFRFSSCSVDYLSSFISVLDSRLMNCLLNNASPGDPLNTAEYLKKYPGQKYSVDQQCQLLYGSTSFYCGGGLYDRSICRQMLCWSPLEGRCTVELEQRAADGTTCADKAWCFMGKCVTDEMAPPAKEGCIYGDYLDIQAFADKSRLSCSTLGKNQPWRCYDPSVASLCCETCANIKANASQDCDYGDKEPLWCASQLRPRDCYDPELRGRCCGTCSRLFTGQESCEYGDRSVILCAPGLLKPYHCYNPDNHCCSSCQLYKAAIRACPRGDLSSWCPQHVEENPSDCALDYFSSVCCLSCHIALSKTLTTTPDTTSMMISSEGSTGTKRESTKFSPETTALLSSTRDMKASSYTKSIIETGVPSETKFNTDLLTDYIEHSSFTASADQRTSRILSAISSSQDSVDDITMTSHWERTDWTTVRTEEPWCTMRDGASFCSKMPPSDCYRFPNLCCQSCSKYQTGIKSCEFGDRVTWCDTYVQGVEECQQTDVAQLCCHTCQPYLSQEGPESTPATGCRDTADYCAAIFPGYCYMPDVSSRCCATCREFSTQQYGCEYGDKFNWCSASHCVLNSRECCQSCYKNHY